MHHLSPTTLARRRLVLLAGLAALWACGDDGGRDPAATTLPPPTSTDTTSEPPGTTADMVADGSTLATTTLDPEPTTTALDETGASTGEPFGEPFSMSDPLIDGTMGTAVGGSFGPEGWTTTDRADRIYWSLPRLSEGSIEFTVTGLTLDLMPLNDHEIFAMYEGGWGIEHPIAYNPEFRVNNYKSMIRIYGQAEVERVGQVNEARRAGGSDRRAVRGHGRA